jgi:hypothetical protein
MKRALIVAILVLAGCGGDGIVDLTIAVAPSVSNTELAQVRSLTLDLTGIQTATVRDPLSRPFANRTERLVVRSHGGGVVMLGITARDGAGAAMLFGSTSLTIKPGKEIAQTVTLSQVAAMPDGGIDLAGADLNMVDQAGRDLVTVPPDLLSPGCPPDVLLCDGFETGTIDSFRWDVSAAPSGGAISLDNTRAHRGTWSLHAHLDPVASGATATANIGEIHTFTPPGASFFVRGWFYFPSATSTATATVIDSGQDAPPYKSLSLATDHDALSIYDNFANPAVYTASTTPKLPLDTWTCIEWQVDTGTPNQIHVSVDGVAVTQLDLMVATRGTPEIGAIYFGLSMYPPNTTATAVDAWIDDIIFDRNAIGCSK